MHCPVAQVQAYSLLSHLAIALYLKVFQFRHFAVDMGGLAHGDGLHGAVVAGVHKPGPPPHSLHPPKKWRLWHADLCSMI